MATPLSRSRFSPEYAYSCPLGGFDPNALGLLSLIIVEPHPAMVDLNRSYDSGAGSQGSRMRRGLLQFGVADNVFHEMHPGSDDNAFIDNIIDEGTRATEEEASEEEAGEEGAARKKEGRKRQTTTEAPNGRRWKIVAYAVRERREHRSDH
jgi:hypothetical protein